MLSIFLTLNLSLRSGPPFMLIDAPSAHIDDLNALSFLDFLADVAETKQASDLLRDRNEKLANLFEKKMGIPRQRLSSAYPVGVIDCLLASAQSCRRKSSLPSSERDVARRSQSVIRCRRGVARLVPRLVASYCASQVGV